MKTFLLQSLFLNILFCIALGQGSNASYNLEGTDIDMNDAEKEKPIVSVLGLENMTTIISNNEIATIQGRLELMLVNSSKYHVISKNERKAILSEQEYQLSSGCVDESCAVEIGNMLGAKFIFSGSVGKVGQIIVLNVRQIDVETGSIIDGAEFITNNGMEDILFAGLNHVVNQFVGGRALFGHVSIITNPAGMTVDLPGVGEYKTPIVDMKIATGNYPITISGVNYQSQNMHFSLSEGQQIRIDDIVMEPLKSNLTLDTDPSGATVTINGENLGTTPYQSSIDYGIYKLLLEKEGFLPKENNMEIDAPEERFLIKFDSLPVDVQVRTNPADLWANLYVDGNRVGYISEAGKRVKLSPTVHVIEVKKEGYISSAQTVDLSQRVNANLHFTLSPKDRKIEQVVEEKKSHLGIGIGASLGFPGFVNYNGHLRLGPIVLEYAAGFYDPEWDLDISEVIDNPQYGIFGEQASIGLGNEKTSINFVRGQTDFFTREMDFGDESIPNTLPLWEYEGISFKARTAMSFLEIGYLQSMNDVHEENSVYVQFGVGLFLNF